MARKFVVLMKTGLAHTLDRAAEGATVAGNYEELELFGRKAIAVPSAAHPEAVFFQDDIVGMIVLNERPTQMHPEMSDPRILRAIGNIPRA